MFRGRLLVLAIRSGVVIFRSDRMTLFYSEKNQTLSNIWKETRFFDKKKTKKFGIIKFNMYICGNKRTSETMSPDTFFIKNKQYTKPFAPFFR